MIPRLANSADFAMIEKLWAEFLAGGTTYFLPTTKTLDSFMYLARRILSKDLQGVVVLVDDVAVHMSGDSTLDQFFDHGLGRFAQGYGTWIRPEFRGKRLYNDILDLAFKELKSLGFTGFFGESRVKNQAVHNSVQRQGFETVTYGHYKKF